jgi:hypothetical protein
VGLLFFFYFLNAIIIEIFSFAALPWEGVSELDAMNKMRNREKLPRPQDCPEAIYRNVLLECWRLDTSKRASAEWIVAGINAYVKDPENYIPNLNSLPWSEMQHQAGDVELTPVNAFIDLKSEVLATKFDSLELERSRLDLQREIGKGQFGSVMLAILQLNDGSKIDVAVKAMHQQDVPEAEIKQFEYEARLLVALEHPNIIRAVGVCFQSAPQLLVLEMMAGGDLKKYLKEQRQKVKFFAISLNRACMQIADAMEYLERKRVVHRDLAARFDREVLGLNID